MCTGALWSPASGQSWTWSAHATAPQPKLSGRAVRQKLAPDRMHGGAWGSDEGGLHVRGRLEAQQVEVGARDVGQPRVGQVLPELDVRRQACAADGHRHRCLQ